MANQTENQSKGLRSKVFHAYGEDKPYPDRPYETRVCLQLYPENKRTVWYPTEIRGSCVEFRI